MRRFMRSTSLAAMCAILPVLAAGSATAAPINPLAPTAGLAIDLLNDVERVQMRKGGGRRAGARSGRNFGGVRGNRAFRSNRGFRSNRRRGSSGRNIGIGLGAAIIGGIILSEAARSASRRDHAGDWDRCAATYRSFEWSTGMYTGYDGIRRTCPYLN